MVARTEGDGGVLAGADVATGLDEGWAVGFEPPQPTTPATRAAKATNQAIARVGAAVLRRRPGPRVGVGASEAAASATEPAMSAFSLSWLNHEVIKFCHLSTKRVNSDDLGTSGCAAQPHH